MIWWNPEKLTRDIGNYIRSRLHLNSDVVRIGEDLVELNYEGINFDIRFKQDNGGRLLLIDVTPSKKELDGLEQYLADEVCNEKVFANGHYLGPLGKKQKQQVPKYSERLKYLGTHTAYGGISVAYEVAVPLLKLNKRSFRESVFNYALAPLLVWARGKK